VSTNANPPPTGQSTSPDDEAVLRAKQEIQGLVQEIVELSKSEVDPGDFYEALLSKSVSALAANGGVIWVLDENGALGLQFQINLQMTGLAESRTAQLQHSRLLQQVMAKGEPVLVAPHSGSGMGGAEAGALAETRSDEEQERAATGNQFDPDDAEVVANPTEYLLVLAPIMSDRGVEGLVEIFQRDGARPTTQRGYLRFLVQICELAGEYVKSRRLRHFATKQSLWEQLESFTSLVHLRLDSRETAYTIANEGRRLIGCDRVTVVLRKGGSYQVEAISGQDTFDKRSNVVRLLRNLSKTVAKTGEDLWFTGDTSDLAPQVEKAVNAYVDQSHTKQLAVLPLHEAEDPSVESAQEGTEKGAKKGQLNVLGALVIEQLVDVRQSDGLIQRVDVVRRHSSTSLTNAQEHEGLFLLPLWRLLGKAKWLVTARTLPKTVAITILLVAAIAALCLVPYDFTVTADGKLLPKLRRNVFAGMDGLVVEVPIRHGQQVEKDQLLARQRSMDLEAEMIRLQGEFDRTQGQIASIVRQRMIMESRPESDADMDELTGQLAQLREQLKSLMLQQKVQEKKRDRLEVTSPIAGKVVSWKVRDMILGRPVRRGQRLMEIADPSSNWELKIYVPESKMGHVVQYFRQQRKEDSKYKMQVTFILATHPSEHLEGVVEEIDHSARLHEEDGNTVQMRVSFDQSALTRLVANPADDLKVGADSKAKIHCGRRAIGYVWFHDLFEFVQSRILFRF
jgi:multidrug efflux pump subunit AcrA (membrane-fusion protein)